MALDNWQEQFDKEFCEEFTYYLPEAGDDISLRLKPDISPQSIKQRIQQLLEDQKRELLEKIKEYLKQEGYLKSLEIIPPDTSKKGHGTCCYCQSCGHPNDNECVCESNRLITDLEALKATFTCSCWCHNPASSVPGCEHCKGVTPIEGKDEDPPEPEDENYDPAATMRGH